MLLYGLTWLVVFQLLGTAVSVLLLPMLPGPIVGLVLLFIFLLVRGHLNDSIQQAATTLLRYLPLMLVPPAIGVMAYTHEILEHFWAIVGVLVVSLMLSLVFTGWLMQRLIERQARRQEEKSC